MLLDFFGFLTKFRDAAIDKKITRWPVHNCSMCDYECGYLFFHPNFDSEVLYDSGCDCTRRRMIGHRTWEDVADHYFLQKNPKVIKRMNEFWGFKD